MTHWERLTYVLLTLPIARSVQIFKHSFPQNFHRKHFFYGSSSSLKTWINIFFFTVKQLEAKIFLEPQPLNAYYLTINSPIYLVPAEFPYKNVLMYPSLEIWTNIT